jgi:hypothetical protein
VAFLELIGSVLRSYPGILMNPVMIVLYLIVMGLIALQYSRVENMEEKIYGRPKNSAIYQTAISIGLGLLGGAIASVVLVVVGVSVSDSGITYLLPLALLLFLISPRFLCYSYAGGIASLSYLLFGWPKVSVSAIMGLVACLHAAEGLLILLSGHSCATPLYIEDKAGRTVGGFSLQRFWPIPLIVLFLVRVPDISSLSGVIQLPDWWPLVQSPSTPGIGTPVYAMMPIVAALGYSDLSLTKTPKEKAITTARHLFLFSGLLLFLAILASRFSPFAWVAAVFSPVAHEIIIKAGSSEEFMGRPLFTQAEDGVMVLDVVAKSLAESVGIEPGDILKTVNGLSVCDREGLTRALQVPGDIRITVHKRIGRVEALYVERPHDTLAPLGIITVPELGDRPMVRPQTEGPLGRTLKNLMKKILA